MKHPLAWIAALMLLLGPGADSILAQCPDAFGLASTINIRGKLYGVDGTETNVRCDTKLGDSILYASCFTCSIPPTRRIDVWAITPQCQALHQLNITIGPPGYPSPWALAEMQVVKNGNPQRACRFHGTYRVGGGGFAPESPYLQTTKKFDSAGVAKSESGAFNYSTADGKMFLGKLKVVW